MGFSARIAIHLLAASLCAACAACATDQTDVQRCAAIEDRDQRLSCFDELSRTGSAPPAEQAAQKQTDDAQDRFGLPWQSPPGERQPRTAAVVATKRDPYGKLTLTLDNGQVWKQLDSKSFRIPDEEPRVVIWKGRLGGFSLKLEGSTKAIRVKRIR
jgi:hypothetical protein